ncbi:unnamed protein product [Cuscuta epithymum]|uniref:Uncharacterized protein n=1 Tax=Cuscuta epithymum TaxID=186058 RepID=A0AAV0DS14_9ASTE|nr:unnamed protein product [Cuscuta epithymum]
MTIEGSSNTTGHGHAPILPTSTQSLRVTRLPLHCMFRLQRDHVRYSSTSAFSWNSITPICSSFASTIPLTFTSSITYSCYYFSNNEIAITRNQDDVFIDIVHQALLNVLHGKVNLKKYINGR